MTLIMKTVNQFFCMTHHLMILHHHSKFGKRWLSGSGDTEWTRSDTWGKHHPNKHPLTFWIFAVTLTFNVVTPFSQRTLWLMMLYYKTKFGCKLASSSEDTTKIAIFWLYKPSLWPWHWTQWTNSSAWHSGLRCCKTIPSLATKRSAVQKI